MDPPTEAYGAGMESRRLSRAPALRRWAIALSVLVAGTLAVPAPAQAYLNTSEWTAIQYLNQKRVELGMGKLQPDSCLERHAVTAANWVIDVYGTDTALWTMAGRVKAACGMSEFRHNVGRAQWAAQIVQQFLDQDHHRSSCTVATDSAIGIAKVKAAPGRWIWYVIVGQPAVA